MRFFFHTQTDVRHTDDEGAEFATFTAARQAAIRTCGQMMRDAPEVFWGSRPWSVTVTDDTGLIMWEIHLDGQSTPASRGLEGDQMIGAVGAALAEDPAHSIDPKISGR